VVTLGAIFKYAVRHKVVDANPLSLMEKYRKGSEGFQEERQYLIPDKVRLPLNHAPEQLRLFIMAAVMTGMREGEVFGLKWAIHPLG